MNKNVVDGDLSPLLEHHPKLSFAGFMNKWHYSHKAEYIKQQLGISDVREVKTTIIEFEDNRN